ncbi:Os05g0277800 [Oryza sativa Japonica Group]|uniref:Os05g0277800 protein n=1 Tax=Oryza sativa subsp. japonica TaxID=39947 RepID=A0A0P0WK60_ORYSJ|nr:Os05g0277800 [Oryza sativa Japonica Group]
MALFVFVDELLAVRRYCRLAAIMLFACPCAVQELPHRSLRRRLPVALRQIRRIPVRCAIPPPSFPVSCSLADGAAAPLHRALAAGLLAATPPCARLPVCRA